MPEPLSSPTAYAAFVHTLPDRYPSIEHSTLVYIPSGALFGRVEGMIFFAMAVVLCVQEYLNFELGVIEGYGYEVSRPQLAIEASALPPASAYCKASYPHKEKLYWYDSFPHPNHPSLASTHPHHKHNHPDIKHNRIPAPGLSFTIPNRNYSGCTKLDRHLPYSHVSLVTWRHTAPRKVPVKFAGG